MLLNYSLSGKMGKTPPRLKGLDFSLEEALEARDNDRILSLALFTPNRCNARCRPCYISAGKDDPNQLSFDEYKEIIDEAKKLRVKTIWTPGAGEPTIWNHFRDFIDYIAESGMLSVVFTNSFTMDSGLAKFLNDRNASVVTKLWSFDKSTADYLVGVNGAYEKMQRGLNILMEEGFNGYFQRTDGVEVSRLAVEMVICGANYQEAPEIFRFARENQIFPYLERILMRGRAAADPSLQINAEQTEKVFNECAEIDRKEFGYDWEPKMPYIGEPCIKIFHNMTVDHQGSIRPCCGCQVYIGNIREQSIQDTINSVSFRNIRQHLHEKIIGPKFYYNCAAVNEPAVRELLEKSPTP